MNFVSTTRNCALKSYEFCSAAVVELLREAGAVLIAKLSTGELAGGDKWFGGQTMNPWNPHTQGASGSSAGAILLTYPVLFPCFPLMFLAFTDFCRAFPCCSLLFLAVPCCSLLFLAFTSTLILP